MLNYTPDKRNTDYNKIKKFNYQTGNDEKVKYTVDKVIAHYH